MKNALPGVFGCDLRIQANRVESTHRVFTMKKSFLLLIMLWFGLASCSLPETWRRATPTLAPMDGGFIQAPGGAQLAQRLLAEEIGVPVEAITIRQIDSQDFRDTCLEVPQVGETCQPRIIPGLVVTLAIADDLYTYHTDIGGQEARRVEGISRPGPAASQAVQLLAGLLGYDPAAIRVLSEDPATFVDGCLEINIAEIPCTQFATRGIRILLRVEDRTFEFRSAETPLDPVLAAVDDFSVIQPAVSWSRRGGWDEFCDGLKIYLNGWMVQYNCRAYATQQPGILRLSPEQQRQLLAWFVYYQPFEFTQSSLDGAAVLLTFSGSGTESAEFEQQREINAYTQDLLLPVGSGTVTPFPSFSPEP